MSKNEYVWNFPEIKCNYCNKNISKEIVHNINLKENINLCKDCYDEFIKRSECLLSLMKAEKTMITETAIPENMSVKITNPYILNAKKEDNSNYKEELKLLGKNQSTNVVCPSNNLLKILKMEEGINYENRNK